MWVSVYIWRVCQSVVCVYWNSSVYFTVHMWYKNDHVNKVHEEYICQFVFMREQLILGVGIYLLKSISQTSLQLPFWKCYLWFVHTSVTVVFLLRMYLHSVLIQDRLIIQNIWYDGFLLLWRIKLLRLATPLLHKLPGLGFPGFSRKTNICMLTIGDLLHVTWRSI